MDGDAVALRADSDSDSVTDSDPATDSDSDSDPGRITTPWGRNFDIETTKFSIFYINWAKKRPPRRHPTGVERPGVW
jgi:hypothetical protein